MIIWHVEIINRKGERKYFDHWEKACRTTYWYMKEWAQEHFYNCEISVDIQCAHITIKYI